MLFFPNAKINLGLHILGKRKDVFHDLETVFYPIPIHDSLEIIAGSAASNQSTENIQYSGSGLTIDCGVEENICIKAYHLLKKDYPQLPAIKMHLHKAIPSGAGLGGGSADAAFTLKLLNEKFQLNITIENLITYATELGSDCPFFIINKPCLASGRGEVLQQIEIDLSAYQLMLVNPGIHINTKNAFAQLKSFSSSSLLKKIITQPVETWKDDLKNDFEPVVFEQYPEINNIKTNLYKYGAIYASMSGSGSSVFGLFKKTQIIKHQFPVGYYVRTLSL